MGTRAVVGYKEEGSEHTVFTYVHCDGMPRVCGAALLELFNTPSKAKDLAFSGQVTGVYVDNGVMKWEDTPEAAKALRDRNKETIRTYFHCYHAYVYVYDANDNSGQWEYCYLLEDNTGFKKLTEADF